MADSVWLSSEVALGLGGYQRALITYDSLDFGNYADGGVGLVQKATVFEHDGGVDDLNFTHVALVWSAGNIEALGTVATAPESATDTVEPYSGVPTTTSGSGVGLTVDISVINGGISPSDYSLTISSLGYGYEAEDVITVSNGVLSGLDSNVGSGDLTTTVSAVVQQASPADSLFSIVKTAEAVVLSGGNQAVFYWSFKQFGFYTEQS